MLGLTTIELVYKDPSNWCVNRISWKVMLNKYLRISEQNTNLRKKITSYNNSLEFGGTGKEKGELHQEWKGTFHASLKFCEKRDTGTPSSNILAQVPTHVH